MRLDTSQFSKDEVGTAEEIWRCRLRILVHSCIYYKLNNSILTDKAFDEIAQRLVRLQIENVELSERIPYADDFRGFDGSTGFDLPIDDGWVMTRARALLVLHGKGEDKPVKSEYHKTRKVTKKTKSKKKKGAGLF